MKENPHIPVVAVVDGIDPIPPDCLATIDSVAVEKYLELDDTVEIYSEMDYLDELKKIVPQGWDLSDGDAEHHLRVYRDLPWKKAIVIHIS